MALACGCEISCIENIFLKNQMVLFVGLLGRGFSNPGASPPIKADDTPCHSLSPTPRGTTTGEPLPV